MVRFDVRWAVVLNLTHYRFGGGSEMMAQGDTNGLWSLLEAGQK